MTPQRLFYIIILTTLTLYSCRDGERKHELDLREQQILEKERAFSLKEADYNALIKMRDSLRASRDTVVIRQWPASIAGVWSGKTVCRESNCPEYVIGDQRSNTWEFVSDSTGLYTRVTSSSNQVIRVYSAVFDSTRIQLFYKTDTSATKAMELSVSLSEAGQNILKGMQTIGINNSCTAKLSVELSRTLTP